MYPYLTKLQVAKFVHKKKHKKAWFENHALSHSSVTYRKILYGSYGNFGGLFYLCRIIRHARRLKEKNDGRRRSKQEIDLAFRRNFILYLTSFSAKNIGKGFPSSIFFSFPFIPRQIVRRAKSFAMLPSKTPSPKAPKKPSPILPPPDPFCRRGTQTQRFLRDSPTL